MQAILDSDRARRDQFSAPKISYGIQNVCTKLWVILGDFGIRAQI